MLETNARFCYAFSVTCGFCPPGRLIPPDDVCYLILGPLYAGFFLEFSVGTISFVEVDLPYTFSQCQLFGAKARRGERVPSDWRKKCAGVNKQKGRARKKRNTRRRSNKVY